MANVGGLGSAWAARAQLGVCGIWVLQTLGFVSDSLEKAGGALGKPEKAEEDRYLREKTRKQPAVLKKHHEDEIDHHSKEIEHLQKQIKLHKKVKHLKSSDH
uniref:ATPase inhibitor, mitochondrial n=1 Tax=Rattus norvegicus TaxID=10116 RepID=A0A8I5Y0D9_RAT